MRRPSRGLRVAVTDGRGRALPIRGLARWLVGVAPAGARGSVGVALLSDSQMRTLNHSYRGKDYATDVLSFPVAPGPGRGAAGAYLGDIAIARGVSRRQARAAGHSVDVELRILALHGLLHLLGYDHERDQGQMERLEARLRKKGRL